MSSWGKRRGLSPLPVFGRAKFDTETRRAFNDLKLAEAARHLGAEPQDPPRRPAVVGAFVQPRRRQAPVKPRPHLGRILVGEMPGSGSRAVTRVEVGRPMGTGVWKVVVTTTGIRPITLGDFATQEEAKAAARAMLSGANQPERT